jgi:hypothetical protein
MKYSKYFACFQLNDSHFFGLTADKEGQGTGLSNSRRELLR